MLTRRFLILYVLLMLFSFLQPKCQTVTDSIVINSYSQKELLKEVLELIELKDYENALALFQKNGHYFYEKHPSPDTILAELYNQRGITYYYLGSVNNTIEDFQKALNLYKDLFGENHLKVANLYKNLGYIYIGENNFDFAETYLRQALLIRTIVLGKNNLTVANSHNDLGTVLSKKGDYLYSKSETIKALKIRQGLLDKDDIEIGKSYMNLGNIFRKLGDYSKVPEFYEKAASIFVKKLGENHPFLANLYENVGILFGETGEIEKAKEYFKKSYDIRLKAFGEKNYNVGQSLMNLGVIHQKLMEYEEAEDCFKRSLAIVIEALGEKHQEVADYYTNLGALYEAQGIYDKSISNYQIAIETNKDLLGKYHFLQFPIYRNLAIAYFKKGELANSEIQFKGAFKTLGLTFEKSNIIYWVETLSLLSYYSDYKITVCSNFDCLDELHNGLSLTLNKLNNHFQTISLKSIVELYENAIPIIENTIQISKTLSNTKAPLHYLTESFSLTERSKSLLLYQSMQESDALHFAGIPDSLLEQEYDLRIDITYYDKKRQEKISEGLEETDTTVLAISSKLFDLNQAYDSLKTRFEKKYPEYYKLKYDLSTISLEEVQQELLESDQALLEYFVGDSSIFIFKVTPDDYVVHEVKRDFPLKEWVEQMRSNISQPHTINLEEYAKVAPKLYAKLIAPVAHQLPERLIIVPDGILGYLPFEALLTEAPENIYAAEALPYLLRKYQISYGYSATLLREMQQKKHRQVPTRGVLAMAPFAEADTILTSHLNQSDWLAALRSDTLTALPGSRIELDSLQAIFPTDAFYGNEATEQEFTQRASHYRILHLSTHGNADSRVGDYSYLAFYPQPDSTENELLYVRDLYNLELNADLVVLSACETGTGELQRGEGIISLARAFAYAGAKSMATTLWKVNDQSTQELIIYFYHYLEAGLPKDQALRQAKLDYLEDHAGSEAYPFHWAAVIGIGDMAPMK